MENFLQQGIQAARAGERVRAYHLLKRATQNTATAEQAWLWLSGIVTVESQRLFCLDHALHINPHNERAREIASTLHGKGIFPTIPIQPPAAQTAIPATAPIPSAPKAKVEQPTQPPPQPLQPPTRTNFANQHEFASPFRFAAQELARKQTPQTIMNNLVSQGLQPETARQLVNEAEKLWKQALVARNKKRMLRGLAWVAIGIALTVGTLLFASGLGGRYILFYGAIGYGVFDFLAGLFGWLWNS